MSAFVNLFCRDGGRVLTKSRARSIDRSKRKDSMKVVKRSAKVALQHALQTLLDSDYRVTQPRRTLLEVIFQQKGPFSVNDLINEFKRRKVKDACDLVTIYRTLPVFETLGIIEKCGFSEGVAFYEWMGDQGEHHHHFICKGCNKIEPLDFCVIEAQEQVLKKMGYTQLTHRLEFAGYCPACSS